MSNYIITIGRQFGCHGKEVGKELAKRLGIEYYDADKVNEYIAEDCGITKKEVDEFMEKRTSSLLYEMAVFAVMGPMEEKVFFSQTKVVKQLAEKSSCVFVGVCADYILKDQENVFKIFLQGDINKRLETAKKDYPGLTEKDIKTADRKRASYYNFFTAQKWGEKGIYDIILNVGLGFDLIIDVLEKIAMEKFGGK